MINRVWPDGTLDEEPLLCEEYLPILTDVGTSEFGLSEADASDLACEVLIASFVLASQISNLRGWVMAAMRGAAKSHQQKTGDASRP